MTERNPPLYGFDAERYRQVDDELKRAEAYFTRLRDELRVKASDSDITVLGAKSTIREIKLLRWELAQQQGRK